MSRQAAMRGSGSDRRSAGSTRCNLDLPVKQSNGDTAWRRPSYFAIHRIMENPFYGGAYA
ncbi:hypothetical protein [Bradyrhizobium sp. BWC-3-1]|uniref:hypothetical protein n=1 Tax=Bradyrhizobium sp. BWC-3-1 TaxID=3080012 RepID=UPI00293F7258|nr:hypothetical protein [Bradyrhizobium sp. BWC-3-1]WOH57660.1 hypothetical protein RX329_36775 [Bradyrhizobium sp. BWC-3-1]